MATIFDQLRGSDAEGVESTPSPSEKIVDWFHGRAGTSRPDDLHHRVGFGPDDVSAGDHTHNGVNSKGLFTAAEVTLTDITATATGTQIRDAVNAINAALRRVGAG